MAISASAVLVELNISVWPASKVDRETTEQTNAQAGAVRDASQTRKNLFAGTSVRKEIENFAAKVRLFHNRHTLPWADKGERLLPTKLFMDYKQHMNSYETQFHMMCDAFFNNYPALVAAAPTNLGKLYKPEDYPSLGEVKSKFAFRRTVKPVPESGDFRLDVPAEDLVELRAMFDQQQREKLAEAVREPWERLHAQLVTISEKMTEGEGDAKKRYHDSLISNPLELCALLTKLNITNDPKLEEARKQLEVTMRGTNLEELKEDSVARSDLKSKVDAIINKFEW
jgi:hypothetical protein